MGGDAARPFPAFWRDDGFPWRRPAKYNFAGYSDFQIGLGLTELFAAESVCEFLGTERKGRVRGFGAREIMAGVGILTTPRPEGWLWARVGGDALDLAALAALCTADNPQRENVIASIGAVAGITALDIYTAEQM